MRSSSLGRAAIRLSVFFSLCIALIASAANAATVETDKWDYFPGDTVYITGTGWEPGETVELYITEEPLVIAPRTYYPVADPMGGIYNDELLIQETDLGQTFYLTATGQSSGLFADTMFWDAACGNGELQTNPAQGEQCDDGDITDGDGCSSSCQIESGWSCAVRTAKPQSVCSPLVVCGDGEIGDGEQCDDSNTANGDCCSSTCQFETGSCSDGNACTQTDTCSSGTCVGSNPVVCTASDQCHGVGTCDSGTGACSDPPLSGTACNDGDACTQTDTCNAGSCDGTNPVICTALDQCHSVGTCNSATGICSDPPLSGTPCTDNDACTTTDTCSAGVCVGGPALDCDDSNVCTDDSCIPASGCSYADNSAPCQDDVFCNGADTCSSGGCNEHVGDPCANGAECNDHCNEAAKNCFEAEGTACSSDGEVCTDDECDGAGECGHVANTDPCDDEVFCNGQDTCANKTCSTHAGDPCLSGTECNDHCNEDAENCFEAAGTDCTDDATECTDSVCGGGEDAGDCTHPTEACSLVTDSSLCQFDVDLSNPTGNQFRLIFTPDQMNQATSKLFASNPGQFYYNVVYVAGDTPADHVDLILPYPFVTKGAQPIHVYGAVQAGLDDDGNTCLSPVNEIAHYSTQVILSDYEDGPTQTVTVPLDDLSTGVAYIDIHLDYGLKGTGNYLKNATGDATDANSPTTVLIMNGANYLFSDSTSGNDTAQSINVFKKNPGIGGLVTHGDGSPQPGVSVKIRDSKNNVVATLTTDEDGWYMWPYKYTGKATTFTVILQAPYSGSQSVTLKSNGFVSAYFIIP